MAKFLSEQCNMQSIITMKPSLQPTAGARVREADRLHSIMKTVISQWTFLFTSFQQEESFAFGQNSTDRTSPHMHSPPPPTNRPQLNWFRGSEDLTKSGGQPNTLFHQSSSPQPDLPQSKENLQRKLGKGKKTMMELLSKSSIFQLDT